MIVTFLDVVLFTTYFILLFISIFWLLVLYSPNTESKKKKLSGTPFFTTIVPAYNEEKSIYKTLKSITNLEYPKNAMETIVINDGSHDNTKIVVEQFIKEHPQDNIILINQKNQGKGRAMNNGLEIAKGEFFACLDADSFIHSNALQEMLPYFEDTKMAAVCPLLKVKSPSTILQKVQWCEYIINMFYKYLNSKINCIHVTPGPFSVYRTKIIQDLGGYDETTITEDLEIAIRLQKHHYKIVQTFDAIVETLAPKSWRALFFQRVRWYKGGVDNTITYKKMLFNKKYGDFGYIRMPTIVLSGILAIILTGAILQSFGSKAIEQLFYLVDINFDIWTLITNYELTFNMLALPFFQIVITMTLISISFLVMIYSYKLVKEQITNHGKTLTSMATYLSIYSIFLTFVWMYIAFIFITGRKNKW